MESDSAFHNLLGCMELLPCLHAVFAIPNTNALPVHCANQVSKVVVFRVVCVVVLSERFGRSSVVSRGLLRSFGVHFGVIFYTFRGLVGFMKTCVSCGRNHTF